MGGFVAIGDNSCVPATRRCFTLARFADVQADDQRATVATHVDFGLRIDGRCDGKQRRGEPCDGDDSGNELFANCGNDDAVLSV